MKVNPADYSDYSLTIRLDKRGCALCPVLRLDHINNMHYCRRTGRDLPDWDTERDAECPLTDIKKEDNII